MCHESTLETDWSEKRRRHLPATTNRGPQPTIASLINIVQMHIVVVTRLLEFLQQHSSSEISTTTTNDISTKPSNFPLQACLANSNHYFCSLPIVQLLFAVSKNFDKIKIFHFDINWCHQPC